MPAPATPSEALAQRLLTDPALIALVGKAVFPSAPPQDQPGDYVVYFRQGGGDQKTLDGPSGLQEHQMRVECYSRTQAGAEKLLAAVAARLCGNPATGAAPWRDRANGVQGCFPQGDADEQVTDDNFQVSGQTFGLWFKAQS